MERKLRKRGMSGKEIKKYMQAWNAHKSRAFYKPLVQEE